MTPVVLMHCARCSANASCGSRTGMLGLVMARAQVGPQAAVVQWEFGSKGLHPGM